jgi:hypothetical protein
VDRQLAARIYIVVTAGPLMLSLWRTVSNACLRIVTKRGSTASAC